MTNRRRRGLTTEGLMHALAAARSGERVLYVCCHLGSARRAKGLAEDLAPDGAGYSGRLRIDFRSGGRLSFADINLALDQVDPQARIALDHAALTRADPFTQNDWAAFAARRGLT